MIDEGLFGLYRQALVAAGDEGLRLTARRAFFFAPGAPGVYRVGHRRSLLFGGSL